MVACQVRVGICLVALADAVRVGGRNVGRFLVVQDGEDRQAVAVACALGVVTGFASAMWRRKRNSPSRFGSVALGGMARVVWQGLSVMAAGRADRVKARSAAGLGDAQFLFQDLRRVMAYVGFRYGLPQRGVYGGGSRIGLRERVPEALTAV